MFFVSIFRNTCARRYVRAFNDTTVCSGLMPRREAIVFASLIIPRFRAYVGTQDFTQKLLMNFLRCPRTLCSCNHGCVFQGGGQCLQVSLCTCLVELPDASRLFGTSCALGTALSVGGPFPVRNVLSGTEPPTKIRPQIPFWEVHREPRFLGPFSKTSPLTPQPANVVFFPSRERLDALAGWCKNNQKPPSRTHTYDASVQNMWNIYLTYLQRDNSGRHHQIHPTVRKQSTTYSEDQAPRSYTF